MNRVRWTEDGFTLVELLLVIIVLGILAAVVIFGLGSTRDDAVRSACATRVRSIAQSAEAVRVRTTAYPAGTIDLASSPNPLVAPESGALLKSWPDDNGFVLKYDSADGTSYSIDVYKSDGTPVSGCGGLAS